MSLPPLAEHLHTEKCVLVIRELHKCHEEKPYGKFFGHCNELKSLLRRCLTEQKEQRRKENRIKGVKVQRLDIGDDK